MTRPVRATFSTSVPRLEAIQTDDGSLSLYDRELDETYHSGCGAAAETWHVYTQHAFPEISAVETESNTSVSETRVVEYGFGTGMGFLQTAAHAIDLQRPLVFISLEKWLLPCDILNQLHSKTGAEKSTQSELESHPVPTNRSEREPFRSSLLDEMLQWRGRLPETCLPGEYTFRSERSIQLTWVIGNAEGFRTEPNSIDCVFFDPFSPKTNPELWSKPVLENCLEMLKPGGYFCSYCVSSIVRKRLLEVGFGVERIPGPPGGKREVLLARKSG